MPERLGRHPGMAFFEWVRFSSSNGIFLSTGCTAEKTVRIKHFDQEIEWHFYEFWDHEGHRAAGPAMMFHDYAWWQVFFQT